MFGKIASDVLGISDIGSVVKPQDYDKVDADDYVMHEENERIFFLIKSKTDEYCFTNKALIHLDGTSAMSKKRKLHRYNYAKYFINNVVLETAGTVDLDIEIKFTMAEKTFSIDVHKKHIEELKDLYKALIKISEIQHEDSKLYEISQNSINTSAQVLSKVSKVDLNLEEQFKAINQYVFDWNMKSRDRFICKDFTAIFEKFINN
ncbi:MAG: PH domain-containing protein [Candidatus Sericytochromatia bacterium]